MKKLIWIFIAVTFLFTACEKDESAVAPATESGFQKDACVITTKMIAGGGKYDENCTGEHVGNITVEEDADGNVTVTYEITVPGWQIDVTQLYVGVESGIPAGKSGNPKIGNFPYKTDHEGGVGTYVYTIPAADVPSVYGFAAHADVSQNPLNAVCDGLPETATISVANPGATSYFDLTLTGAGMYDGTYAAWCIDIGHSIAQNTALSSSIFCLDEVPAILSTGDNPHIDKLANLPIINWIINQGFVGQMSACHGGTEYTFGDVQRAIWHFIDNSQFSGGISPWSQCRVDEIIAAVAAAGSGATNYVSPAGGFGAVLFVPEGNSQVLIVVFQLGEEADETAWGYGYCAECGSVGDCHDGETGVAEGISFTESTEYYGGSQWGWYFYGCDFAN